MIKRYWRLALFVGAIPAGAQAQNTGAVSLTQLQDMAIQRDPRLRQVDLLAAQSALRLRNIAVENLPSLSVNAQSQYQSTVATIPVALPGITIPRPPHDTYDASVSLRQRLFDPALRERRRIESAQLDESRARVRSAVFGLRQSVADAYFSALDLQLQQSELEAVIADLEAQHKVVVLRLNEGAALPSEARILEAEMMRRRQMVRQLEASAGAARDILADLTGVELPAAALVPMPDDGARVAEARGRLSTLRSRPEFSSFEAQKEVIERQRSALAARELPRISAFARGGYGRPGLNPLASDFDSYWIGGIQLEWNPWSWGSGDRDRQVLSLQQQIVDSEQSAFARTIERAVIRDIADIDRLEASLEDDARIIEARESILRETRARFREGVITSAEYVDRQTDLLTARLALLSHRVELAEARARFLTTLGLEAQ